MATQLAAYDAAPLPPPAPAPMAVYLVEDGVPTEIAGVEDFDITVENPTAERADAPELDITLDYEPGQPAAPDPAERLRRRHRYRPHRHAGHPGRLPSPAAKWTAP